MAKNRMNNDEKIAALKDRIFDLLYKYPYPNSKKAVNKAFAELKYLSGGKVVSGGEMG